MAQLNGVDFLAKWATLFADNTTGEISAQDMRDFRQDIKDSFLSSLDNFIDEDDFSSDSATKVPSQQSVKAYIADQIDGTLLGIYNDRGNHDASGNTFPSSGGSGTAGAILKGDIWTISVAGTLGGDAVQPGDTVRALVDTPGSTAGNWAIAETNIGYVPENVANKSTSTSLGTSDTLYPSQNAVKEYVDGAKTYDGTQTFMPGTTAAVPIVLQSGTAKTTPQDGAIEYHSSHLYFTIGSTRYQLDGGNIGGSTGASDNSILRADGTGGSTLQNSSAFISDLGFITTQTSSPGAFGGERYSNADASGSSLALSRSRNSTNGLHTIVQNGDEVGSINFRGSDGTGFRSAGYISVVISGTPGALDMPGTMIFYTTADGASTGTERLRITNTGAIGVNGTNYGTSGQVLRSQGSSSPPIWDAPRASSTAAPSSASDTGTAGEIRYDSSYIYICTATNTWKRVAIATW